MRRKLLNHICLWGNTCVLRPNLVRAEVHNRVDLVAMMPTSMTGMLGAHLIAFYVPTLATALLSAKIA